MAIFRNIKSKTGITMGKPNKEKTKEKDPFMGVKRSKFFKWIINAILGKLKFWK